MVIDLLVLVAVISAIFRGFKIGLVRQLCSTIGFFGGLLLGAWLEPRIINLVHSADARAALAVLSILGSALIFLTVGEYSGLHLKHWVLLRQQSFFKRLNSLDNGLGSVLSVISVLLSVWLVASILNSSSIAVLQTAVRSSRIIAQLNRHLPPAPGVIAKLSHLVNPNGFPDVFIGNEPIPPTHINLPALGDLATAVNDDKNSVVRIRGEGCGGIVSGSGFVVNSNGSSGQSTDLVATNAHVVAGISAPYVQDVNGTHPATVIWFDPNLDFALLRVSGLAGHSLAISSSSVATGTPAAVLGYPGGGSFTADPAAVLSTIDAIGHNIYGTGHTLRAIYEVRADIIPGNSGGPLIAKDGSVIGVVFAESTAYNHVGYALSTSKVSSEINQVSSRTQSVSTGQCAE